MKPINLYYLVYVSDNSQYLTQQKQAPNFLSAINCTWEKPTILRLEVLF